MGPVVGLAGALMADAALRVLQGDPSVLGSVMTYDGLQDRLRTVEVRPRRACPLCGPERTIFDTKESRYTDTFCAA
jgi:molybdopterin/thiamine biosynthesis adenylyltransferase